MLAKINIDAQTEIPEKSTGRFVEALCDSLSPFTESLGLLGDQVRLYRQDVLIKIAEKAKSRAHIEGFSIKPIPNKVIVPFLEKASLESIDDQDMQERWAALLVSASKNVQSQHLTFIDILSRLSSEELTILEKTCFSFSRFPELSYPHGHYAGNKSILERNAKMLFLEKDEPEIKAKEKYEQFMNLPELKSLMYAQVMYATVARGTGLTYFYTEYSEKRGSVEILQREMLLEQKIIEIPHSEKVSITVGYFNITHLGVKFVQNCSPNFIRNPNRR